jgi:hypothetical protein
MKTNETIGRPEIITFQTKNGALEKRLMHPVLDEFGGIIRWVDNGAAVAHQRERGVR